MTLLEKFLELHPDFEELNEYMLIRDLCPHLRLAQDGICIKVMPDCVQLGCLKSVPYHVCKACWDREYVETPEEPEKPTCGSCLYHNMCKYEDSYARDLESISENAPYIDVDSIRCKYHKENVV